MIKYRASSKLKKIGIDGATAAADIAYRMSEMCFMFPITPSTPLGEYTERWASEGKTNIFGRVLDITQMQAESGASGAIHGAAELGVLTTTFTASQGLLLMIPDLYRMAGDCLPGVFHVAARSIGTHGISIYGDHSDIQIAKKTGVALIASSTVQECADLAAIAHSASISSSYPFIHFFDGFRTSHEINSINPIKDDTLKDMIDYDKLLEIKSNSLSPDHPDARGLIYPIELNWQFQERSQKRVDKIFPYVFNAMKNFEKLTSRHYEPIEYFGPKLPTKLIIAMGSGARTVEQFIKNRKDCGVVNIHLYRPFNAEYLNKKIPSTVKIITVLDRTRDPLSLAEPLYQDVVTAMQKVGRKVKVIGGKYGISSKNFSPTHVDSIIKNMESLNPMDRFSVGINDDVNHTSLKESKIIEILPEGTKQCIFWGFGSDGTVGACKDAIKIIVNNTDLYGQGHFEYTAHKSGGITTSYLRFGPERVEAPYLIQKADYIACHKQSFVEKFNPFTPLKDNGIVVFNKSSKISLDDYLSGDIKQCLARKKARIYEIDASEIATKLGLPGRINTIMQSVFFLLSNVISKEKALELMKDAARKTYSKKGEHVVDLNVKLIDSAESNLKQVKYDVKKWLSCGNNINNKEKNIVELMIEQRGNEVPVSATYDRGINPLGTTKYEKRTIAEFVPEWNEKKCVQCGLCTAICPHAVIRGFLLDDKEVEYSKKMKLVDSKLKKNYKFTIQISSRDCTGCSKCVHTCPVFALSMVPSQSVMMEKQKRFDYCVSTKAKYIGDKNLAQIQFIQPLLEFNGACAGCGETAIVKMISQLYGDISYFTFATGCPVVWGATSPIVAYTSRPDKTGPAWSSSLYEDHAEFGFGQQKALNLRRSIIKSSLEEILKENQQNKDIKVVEDLLNNFNKRESKYISKRFLELFNKGAFNCSKKIKDAILYNEDYIGYKMNWIFGGDGWAYDIGYGGLDHILNTGENLNIVVLDTEVYSNTGGQPSKGSQRSASHPFAYMGVNRKKKDLALIAQTYQNVYVANTCFDADPKHALKVIKEASSYDGPSLIINYCPCIEQGYQKGLGNSVKHCKELLNAGYLILSRFDPRKIGTPEGPLQIDSKKPTYKIDELINQEVRFSNLAKRLPKRAEELRDKLHKDLISRYESYERLAASYKIKKE